MSEIVLNPDAVKIIDDYLEQKRPPQFRGLERCCTLALETKARQYFHENCVCRLKRIVRLKSEPYRETELDIKFDTYFQGISFLSYIPWGGYNGRSGVGYKYFLQGKCRLFFEEHADDIISVYISDRWESIANAVNNTNSYLELCKDYAKWFNEKRVRFMKDFDTAIAKVKKFQMCSKPQSHGGVANLLKVLTQTMQKQGADIKNIAKVQYTVCLQAGIYIPDEFVNDVAIAMDVIEKTGGENESSM